MSYLLPAMISPALLLELQPDELSKLLHSPGNLNFHQKKNLSLTLILHLLKNLTADNLEVPPETFSAESKIFVTLDKLAAKIRFRVIGIEDKAKIATAESFTAGQDQFSRCELFWFHINIRSVLNPGVHGVTNTFTQQIITQNRQKNGHARKN